MLLKFKMMGHEASESSDDESLSDLTKLQRCMCKTSVSKESLRESCPEKESLDLEEDSSRIGNTFWYSCGKCR